MLVPGRALAVCSQRIRLMPAKARLANFGTADSSTVRPRAIGDPVHHFGPSTTNLVGIDRCPSAPHARGQGNPNGSRVSAFLKTQRW